MKTTTKVGCAGLVALVLGAAGIGSYLGFSDRPLTHSAKPGIAKRVDDIRKNARFLDYTKTPIFGEKLDYTQIKEDNKQREITPGLVSYNSSTWTRGKDFGYRFQKTVFYLDGKPIQVRTRYFETKRDISYEEENRKEKNRNGNKDYEKARLILEESGKMGEVKYKPEVLNCENLDKLIAIEAIESDKN